MQVKPRPRRAKAQHVGGAWELVMGHQALGSHAPRLMPHLTHGPCSTGFKRSRVEDGQVLGSGTFSELPVQMACAIQPLAAQGCSTLPTTPNQTVCCPCCS